MSKFINKLECNFTQISNKIIQDNNISGTAFKLYCYIVSRIANNSEWEFYNKDMEQYFKEGRKAFKNAKDELILCGYLRKVSQNKRNDGTFGACDYEIFSTPCENLDRSTPDRYTVDGSTVDSASVDGSTYKDIETKEERTKEQITNKSRTAKTPNSNPQSPKEEQSSEAIPTCIDSDTWEEWKHYRHKEKKQKLTPSTTQKQLQQLQKWHSEGHDPNEIINCSIMNGWSGLFPPKDKQIKQSNQAKQSTNTPQDHLDKKVEKLITEIKSELLEYPDDFYNRSEQLKRTAEDWKIIENNSKIHEKYNIKDYRFVLDYILEIKQPCGKKGVPRAEFMSSYKNEFINTYGESSVLALYNYFIATKDEKFFPSVEDYGK